MIGFFHNLWTKMNYKTSEVEEHLTSLGYFIIVSFPVFYFINKFFIGIIGFESMFLRLSIGVLGVLLVTRRYFPNKFRKVIPFILYLSLLYAFPFFFFFMLFNNPDSIIWKINVLSGLFFLSFFLNWREYLIFSVIGFFLAWLAINLSGTGHFPDDIVGLTITYINPVIYLALFSRKKDNINQEKLLAMKTLAGTVAHEMRTPFLGIRANAGCLKRFLPVLIDGYNKAKTAQLEVQPLSENNLQHLIEAPDDLDKITTIASLVIDMLLMSLKDKDQNGKIYEACSMRACIAEALREYPLTEEESMLISWENNTDFIFYGNALLMKHVLFNLLKNALYYVKAARKGEISIWVESTPKGNYLYFKDTGKGVAASVVPHIFDRFYAHTRHGTGIGLAFCKTVIESFGGTIVCDSIEGEYTTFILKLSIIKEL